MWWCEGADADAVAGENCNYDESVLLDLATRIQFSPGTMP
jgi:hypothetical protein